jgi:O-antigen ligase
MAIATIFIKTELGLLYLALFIPLQNVMQKVHIFPFGKDFVDILMVALIIGWLIRGRSRTGKIYEKTSSNFPIFFYIIFTYISLLWGTFYLNLDIGTLIDVNNIRLQDWKNLVELPILYFITVNNVKDRKWLKLIILTGLVSMFFANFFFYREFRWYKRPYYTHDMRVNASFSYLGPNELGAFFAQYAIIVITLLLFAPGFKVKIFLGVLFAFNFYCVMYSYSRAAYLAFPISLAFILLFKSKKLLLVFIVLLCLAPRLLPMSVMQRIEMTMLSEEEKTAQEESAPEGGKVLLDSSSEGRFGLWENALKQFQENPILGTGFRTYSGRYGVDTHNNFAKMLAESGIIGLLIYLYLYYLAFKSGWQLYRISKDWELKGLGLGFAGCVIANIIVNTTHDNWSYLNLMGFYWIFWGLVERGKLIIEKESLGK